MERQRLAALEQILIDKNVVTHGELDHVASGQEFAESSRDGLDALVVAAVIYAELLDQP